MKRTRLEDSSDMKRASKRQQLSNEIEQVKTSIQHTQSQLNELNTTLKEQLKNKSSLERQINVLNFRAELAKHPDCWYALCSNDIQCRDMLASLCNYMEAELEEVDAQPFNSHNDPFIEDDIQMLICKFVMTMNIENTVAVFDDELNDEEWEVDEESYCYMYSEYKDESSNLDTIQGYLQKPNRISKSHRPAEKDWSSEYKINSEYVLNCLEDKGIMTCAPYKFTTSGQIGSKLNGHGERQVTVVLFRQCETENIECNNNNIV